MRFRTQGRNACGCRIVPINDEGSVEDRDVKESDISANLSAWVDAWNRSQTANN